MQTKIIKKTREGGRHRRSLLSQEILGVNRLLRRHYPWPITVHAVVREKIEAAVYARGRRPPPSLDIPFFRKWGV